MRTPSPRVPSKREMEIRMMRKRVQEMTQEDERKRMRTYPYSPNAEVELQEQYDDMWRDMHTEEMAREEMARKGFRSW